MAEGTLFFQTTKAQHPMVKDARGIKRTCQSSECGSRFYDLNRDPIVCPICGTIYEIAHAPPGAVIDKVDEASARKTKKSEFASADGEADEKDEEEDLVDVEADDDLADADDDTFLEDEETDGGDVSNIIGGAHDGDEDET
ncbi:TIGR02300 family protein [Filomicrobium insigne]|uniref:TIGR02300 family protein n=1 Tax=Filomicrobium insigne TaxID=418854 RepID=A0A1H0HH61_9HYPH|nr:TIGR02300 family protein [Filomicrobium insigne]SDO18373.1 TIGR02300 family protein [Filomicrobium insigne]